MSVVDKKTALQLGVARRVLASVPKQTAIDFLRGELKERDLSFRMHEAQVKLISARDKARDSGIHPGDSRFPELEDVDHDFFGRKVRET